jgi:hypothetical protein
LARGKAGPKSPSIEDPLSIWGSFNNCCKLESLPYIAVPGRSVRRNGLDMGYPFEYYFNEFFGMRGYRVG